MDEARYLCDFIDYKMAELTALKASTAPAGGPSRLAAPPPPPPSASAQGEQGLETEIVSVVEEPRPTAFLAVLEDDEGWLADESWEAMDGSNVDKMLALSVKPSTAVKYGCIWDKQMGRLCDVPPRQRHAAGRPGFGDLHRRYRQVVGIRGSSHDGPSGSSPLLRIGGVRVPVWVPKIW
jgi:hypothetical protein